MLFGSRLSSRMHAGQVSLASLTQPAFAWTGAFSGRPMACCLKVQVLVLAYVCAWWCVRTACTWACMSHTGIEKGVCIVCFVCFRQIRYYCLGANKAAAYIACASTLCAGVLACGKGTAPPTAIPVTPWARV